MSLIKCNAYTCFPTPDVWVNPYGPTPGFTPLSSLDDAAFYVPVAQEPWHHAMARDIYQSRTEDEFSALVYAPQVEAFAARAAVPPVPEAPVGALLLTVLVMVGLWKVVR